MADIILNEMRLQYREDTHDREIIAHILERNVYRLPNDMNDIIAIDVGAHIGSFAVAVAQRGAKVFSFEPEADNFKYLEQNMKENGINGKAFCLGVGEPGQRKLYLHPKNTGMHSAYLNETDMDAEKFQMAEFVTLKEAFDLCQIQECDLLKLDCEHSEFEIIDELLSDSPIKAKELIVEFHGGDRGYMDKLKHFCSWERISEFEYKFKRL